MGQRTRADYLRDLEAGKQFEEIASRFLTSQGFPIGLNFSAKGQWEFGESAAHVEIKNDRRWPDTGNLFIETRECRHTEGGSAWRDAGIFDASKPWFYLIGDKSKLWLMSVRWLQLMAVCGKYDAKQTATAQGFLVPIAKADKFAIMLWEDWANLQFRQKETRQEI